MNEKEEKEIIYYEGQEFIIFNWSDNESINKTSIKVKFEDKEKTLELKEFDKNDYVKEIDLKINYIIKKQKILLGEFIGKEIMWEEALNKLKAIQTLYSENI